jgi:hypothetical protein
VSTGDRCCAGCRSAVVNGRLLGVPRRFAFVLVAILISLAPSARATDYEWHGGNFSESGIPNPLQVPDSATLLNPITNTPTFDVNFTNMSTFSYRDSGIIFGDARTVTNNGQWISLDDHDLLRFNVPTPPIFINNGTFRKFGGLGSTKIVLPFINSGEIRADSGLIQLDSSTSNPKTYLSGTQFTGTGQIKIGGGAFVGDCTFVGDFTSSNLEMYQGIYTGNDATLSEGNVLWTGGGFAGQWTNQGMITAQDGGGGLGWGAGVPGGVAFTNENSIVCNGPLTGGFMVVGGDSQITNNSTFVLQMSDGGVFGWNNQGSRPTFINNLTLLKTSQTVNSLITFGTINFVNTGTGVIYVAESPFANTLVFNGPATFQDGTRFVVGGLVEVNHDATFQGRYLVEGGVLLLGSGIFQGVDAHMTATGGDAETLWEGGTLRDEWTNEARFKIFELSPLAIDGHFTNDGVVTWSVNGDLTLAAGTVFDNQGTFNVLADLNMDGDVLGATFHNFGQVTKGPDQTTNIRADAINDSGARIDVVEGTLKFLRTLTQRGTMVLHNAVLEVPNGTENRGIIDGIGTLTVSGHGNIINHGFVAPGLLPEGNPGTLRIEGNLGTLMIDGNYTHAQDAVFEIDLQDVANVDRLMINGDVSLLGGELALFCHNCNFQVGQTLDILDATGQLTGTFDSVSLNGFPNGWQFDVAYDYAAGIVRLLVQSVPTPTPTPTSTPNPPLGCCQLANSCESQVTEEECFQHGGITFLAGGECRGGVCSEGRPRPRPTPAPRSTPPPHLTPVPSPTSPRPTPAPRPSPPSHLTPVPSPTSPRPTPAPRPSP